MPTDLPSSEFLAELFHISQEAHVSYCFDLSALQDSFRYRALARSRALAHYLVDESGEIDKTRLDRICQHMQENGYIFYPDALSDAAITEHMLHFLKQLQQNAPLLKTLRRFQKPLCHKWAEQLVKDTMPGGDALSNAHIRRAVLCACLTPLRQNVGSCFATAPAILIQKEQIETFLDDLYQLLSTGKLKRTFGGKEYSVPLCASSGVGDLRKSVFSLDSKARIWVSPGLIAAYEAIGIIEPSLSFEEKSEVVKECLNACAKIKNKMSVEEFIHQSVLIQMGISDEDLAAAAHVQQLQHKTAAMRQMHIEPLHSKKIDMLTEFERKIREAKAVFTGICDNALLKAWEFTLASFVDVKMEFSRWNLYKSLGLDAQERGGIGECIVQHIDAKLQAINEKIEQFQNECAGAYDAMKATEALLRHADSESSARRLQAEYQARAHHMQSCLDIRDSMHAQGTHLSDFFNFLTKQYNALVPAYFQEVYDPSLVMPHLPVHEDALAGFRLVYKHGRSDPTLWTTIHSAHAYIDALVDFFSAIELHIASQIEWEKGKDELSEITTTLLSYLRSDTFLHGAMLRAKSDDPTLEKMPWAYLSGGTMTTLLKTYFCKEAEHTKETKWVENESELLIFILDSLKNLPPRILDPFAKNASKAMLMTSPSHAFLLHPGKKALSEGWHDNGFTYTWVRDHISIPSQKFFENMQLTTSQQIFLFDEFSRELPPMLVHSLSTAWHVDPNPVSIRTWRNHILDTLMTSTEAKQPFQKQVFADGLDALLFQTLPIVPASDWKLYVKRLLSDLYDGACKDFLFPLSDVPSAYITAKKIKEIAKICYAQSRRTVFLPFDLHQYIADHARYIGIAPPTSLIVADTNWANQYFGFVVNPGTMRLELWSLDKTASRGTPMSDWKSWMNGTQRTPWMLYVNPAEYTSAPSGPHIFGKV